MNTWFEQSHSLGRREEEREEEDGGAGSGRREVPGLYSITLGAALPRLAPAIPHQKYMCAAGKLPAGITCCPRDKICEWGPACCPNMAYKAVAEAAEAAGCGWRAWFTIKSKWRPGAATGGGGWPELPFALALCKEQGFR